jgi:hypothetical protein
MSETVSFDARVILERSAFDQGSGEVYVILHLDCPRPPGIRVPAREALALEVDSLLGCRVQGRATYGLRGWEAEGLALALTQPPKIAGVRGDTLKAVRDALRGKGLVEAHECVRLSSEPYSVYPRLEQYKPVDLSPLRALANALVLPALCEAWKARNPHATITVDPSRDWAVVTLGLGPWQETTRLWWQRRERPLAERAEDLLECCWAEAADALARGWRPGR